MPADVESLTRSPPVESSTSESDSSRSSHAVDEEVIAGIVRNVPIVQPATTALGVPVVAMFMHKTWQTVHKAHAVDATKLSCGRMKQAACIKFDLEIKGRILCMDCFGRLRD